MRPSTTRCRRSALCQTSVLRTGQGPGRAMQVCDLVARILAVDAFVQLEAVFDSGLVWVCVYRFIGVSALGSPCAFETNCCWVAVVVFSLFSGGL